MPKYMIPYVLTERSYLYWKDNNNKVIISSHGEMSHQLSPLSSFSFNLRFRAQGNRTTHGNVDSILAMKNSEFMNEPKGTSNIAEHVLNWYEYDRSSQIKECLENAYDVVTLMKAGWPATLGKVLKELQKFNRYQDVYCLFCRVAHGKSKIKIAPDKVLAEFKRKHGK